MAAPFAEITDAEREAIRLALREDAATDDVTSRVLVPESARGRASIVARADGIACGAEHAGLVFEELARGGGVVYECATPSGARVCDGRELARIEGPLRVLLAGERTAVNLVQRMSGVASLTAQFVAAVAGTRARILATRKTAPALRAFDLFAVRAGGGDVHRASLADRILVKRNHLLAARSAGSARTLADAIALLRSAHARVPIGIEVTDLDELRVALLPGIDLVLLDNFSPELCREAVSLRDAAIGATRERPEFEASGGISLATVRRFAQSGVERISVGALTHSAPALDVSMKIVPA